MHIENMFLPSLDPEVVLQDLTKHISLLQGAEVANLGPLRLLQEFLKLQSLLEEAGLQGLPLNLQHQQLLHLQFRRG